MFLLPKRGVYSNCDHLSDCWCCFCVYRKALETELGRGDETFKFCFPRKTKREKSVEKQTPKKKRSAEW